MSLLCKCELTYPSRTISVCVVAKLFFDVHARRSAEFSMSNICARDLREKKKREQCKRTIQGKATGERARQMSRGESRYSRGLFAGRWGAIGISN